ncbi:CRISPR-associated RAMP protein Csx7 [Polyangium sp. 15x6]|uniref:type III CRISPR-associated RAMP protein Csx7 n=1 Tax=Polyangium sp. 15x6 TaxID=3042687 RepID=UPI002499F428|nr:CRISPR-associated RAMP protein Csx7 [Polyangium sp. 15x6]MDI3290986.1 CRISPR-associated RAMP protein Csx7 [Polyangium sp. 15x6]
MFKKSYNRAVLRIRVETVTPLLIKAGDAGLDPTAADLTCVRTRHATQGATVYIPGSSLKGVIRSAAEASVRGQTFAAAGASVAGACNPLEHQTSCGQFAGRRSSMTATEIHQKQCLACRLFGSLALKGRASVRDLFPWVENGDGTTGPSGTNHRAANQVEMRHGVAIDRVVGSVRHGPFEQELVPAGISFWGEIALENYQVWQLGLLTQGLDEITDGFAQLGSSKSRGLGVARVEVQSILHEQPGRAGSRPVGVGALAPAEEKNAYALCREGELPAVIGEPRGLSIRFNVREPAMVQAWLDAGRRALGSLS